jgi:hypothetical protein
VTVAICVHSVFVNSLLVPFIMEPLWLLWGFAALCLSAVRARSTGIPRPPATLRVV